MYTDKHIPTFSTEENDYLIEKIDHLVIWGMILAFALTIGALSYLAHESVFRTEYYNSYSSTYTQ